jgi:hypothetical protein
MGIEAATHKQAVAGWNILLRSNNDRFPSMECRWSFGPVILSRLKDMISVTTWYIKITKVPCFWLRMGGHRAEGGLATSTFATSLLPIELSAVNCELNTVPLGTWWPIFLPSLFKDLYSENFAALF